MSQELFNKAVEHNRESGKVLRWLSLVGLLAVLAGVLLVVRPYEINWPWSALMPEFLYSRLAQSLIILGLLMIFLFIKSLFTRRH
jgi:hypothetical protein